MPRYLKAETIRNLRVSKESLRLGLRLLGEPLSGQNDERLADLALAIGLIGVSGELAVTACLFEIAGKAGIVRKDSGRYKTFGEALADLKAMIDGGDATKTLAARVTNADEHLSQLRRCCQDLVSLSPIRANALHVGIGPSRDVSYCGAWNVVEFLTALSHSPKWRPYLADVPVPPPLPKERSLIAQDIARKMSTDPERAREQLLEVFLVLPDLIEDEPEWLAAFERVQVATNKQDIAFLSRTLEKAAVADIFRIGKTGSAHPMRVDAKNPDAIPVHPSSTRSVFGNNIERWQGLVAAAIDAFERGQIDVPSLDVVCEMMALGFANMGLEELIDNGGLTAHQVWPFVAGALSVQGTAGPCFWVARTLAGGQFGQLRACLERTGERSRRLRLALPMYLPLLESLALDRLADDSPVATADFYKTIPARRAAKARLVSDLRKRLPRIPEVDISHYQCVIDEIESGCPTGPILDRLVADAATLEDRRIPIMRLIVGAMSQRDDLPHLVPLIRRQDLSDIPTRARQAIRELDLYLNGPDIGP